MTLLPTTPGARREAEGYLRVFSAGVFWIAALLTGGTTWGVYRDIVPPEMLGVAGVTGIPILVLALGSYINSRAGYRYFSSSVKVFILVLVGAVGVTVTVQMAGSTTHPTPALYVLMIMLTTMYFSPTAGLLAAIFSSVCFIAVIVAERVGGLVYSPAFPAKQALVQALPEYGSRIAFVVLAINVIAFVLARYVGRASWRHREEAETTNQELKALDARKNQYLSIVAHDLRTPLTSILGFSELLGEEDGELSLEDQQKFAHIISGEAQRLNRLVTDLLDLDKMEAGEMEWNLTRQNIQPLLESAAHVFEGATREKGVSMVTDITSFLPDISVDAPRFSQLLANLLSNAIKFTPNGGSVKLLAAPSADNAHVEIAVTDTGSGIAQDDIGRIFDRFSQTKTGKTKGTGVGLGLAIVKEIVSAHGGEVFVSSVVGQGATFTVSLPLAA